MFRDATLEDALVGHGHVGFGKRDPRSSRRGYVNLEAQAGDGSKTHVKRDSWPFDTVVRTRSPLRRTVLVDTVHNL